MNIDLILRVKVGRSDLKLAMVRKLGTTKSALMVMFKWYITFKWLTVEKISAGLRLEHSIIKSVIRGDLAPLYL